MNTPYDTQELLNSTTQLLNTVKKEGAVKGFDGETIKVGSNNSLIRPSGGLNRAAARKDVRSQLNSGFNASELFADDAPDRQDTIDYANDLQVISRNDAKRRKEQKRRLLDAYTVSERERSLYVPSSREATLQSQIDDINTQSLDKVNDNLNIQDAVRQDIDVLNDTASESGRTFYDVGLREDRAITSSNRLIDQNNRVIRSNQVTSAGLEASLDTYETQRANELAILQNERLNEVEMVKAEIGLDDQQFLTDVQTIETLRTFEQQDRVEATQDLNTILDATAGMTYAELDTKSQSQIAELIADTPLSLGMVKRAMLNAKQEMAIQKEIQQLEIDAQKQNISLQKDQFDEGVRQFDIENSPSANINGIGLAEDGTEIARTSPPDKPTTSENNSYIFFQRMENAVSNLDTLEDDIAESGFIGQLSLNYGNSMTQGKEVEAYAQSMREFTEARLRRDSGAAIPPEEFANDRKTYFAQPGDSAETLEQKKKSREVALDAMRKASGNAYWEDMGESPIEASRRIRVNGRQQKSDDPFNIFSEGSNPGGDVLQLNFETSNSTPSTSFNLPAGVKRDGPVDMNKIIQAESRGSYTAVNPTSGAYGKYQFIPSTLKEYARKTNQSIAQAKTPAGQEKMFKAFTQDNENYLRSKGIPINTFTTYLAHQQGMGGAVKILTGNIDKTTINNMNANIPTSARETGNVYTDFMNYWQKKMA